MFGLGLDQRGWIDREHLILNGLAKNQREGVPVAIPRRRRPFPILALLKQPFLNILSCNPFGRHVVEMFTDDLKFDHKLMVMLGRVALFRIEFGFLGHREGE